MTTLSATTPIEPAAAPVGRRTVELSDESRGGRKVVLDVWYPALAGPQPLTSYEPIPGVSFESANAHQHADIAPGSYPLILVSHGRTGMRFAYSLLSEALAARGAIVASPDHAGDVMTDWLGGTFADDRTNEINRVGDSHFVLDTLLSDLKSARRTGVAYDREEHTLGICAVGVALHDPLGNAVAISVPVPSQRFQNRQALIAERLVATKHALESRMNSAAA